MWEAELSGHSPSPSLFIVKIAPQHCYIALVLYSAQWFHIVKTRHKISSLVVISRVFPNKFLQIYIYFHIQRMSFTLSWDLLQTL